MPLPPVLCMLPPFVVDVEMAGRDAELALSEVVAAGLDLLVCVSAAALLEAIGCVVRLWEASVRQSELMASTAFDRSSFEQVFSRQGWARLFMLSWFFGEQMHAKSIRPQPVAVSVGRRHVTCGCQ